MSDDLEQLTSELSDNDNKDNVEKGDNDVAITADTVEEEKSKLHVNVTDEKNTDELCRENLERQIGDETSAAENEDDNMITTVEFVDKTSVEKEDTDEHVDEIKSKTKGGDGPPDDEDRIENEGDKNDETKLIIMTGGEPGDDKASIDEEHDKNVEIKFQVENSDDEIMSDESKSDGNFGETICDQQESSSSNEKVEVEIIKPAAAAAPSTKNDNNNDIEGLMEQKFSGFLQSKINKNLIKQKPEETTTTNAFEKKNEEEPDELQLIYKGLTDPSLSSKKPTGKTAADDNVEKVTTKNLIEVLEDESDDIDVNVPPGLKDGDRNNNSSVVVSSSIISGDVNKPRRMNQTTTGRSQDSGDSLKNKIILNTDTQSRNKQQNQLQNNNREKTRTNKPAMVASSQSSIATNEKEFRIQQQPQPRRIADTNTVRNSKSSIQLKIPMITLVKLEDRLQEFEHEPYTDNLKMHLNYFSSKDKNKIDINKIISNDFFIKIEKADDVLPVLGSIVSGAAAKETISSAIEESAKIEAAAANNNKENQLILLEQQIQEEETEQPPQELQQPKRRGRKKGYKKAVVEDEYVTHDTGRKEPVKFSMQTRKRRLKFLPDGSLVCHRYSPPSDRKTESESSQSGSDTDAELNSLLSIDGPPAAKRKYVKKEPPTAEKKRVGRPRKKLSPTETTVTADQQQQQKLFKKSQQNVVSEQIIGLPVADVLSRIFQINDLIRSDLDVRTFKQQATTTAVVTTSSSPIKKCNLMLIKRNEKPAKNGIINATDNKLSSGGGNMRFKYLSTTDKLKLIGFDENNDGAGGNGNLGGIVAKCKDKIAKYNAIEPNVIRDATSSSFGRIRSVVCPEQKTKSSSGSTATSSRKVVFNNKHGDGNSNRMIKKDSEIEQLLLPPDKKKSNNNNNVVGKTTSVGGSVYSSDDDEHNFDDKDEDYNVDMDDDDYSDSDSKKKKTLVNKSFSDTCDVAMKEVSKKNDEHQKKFYSSCSSSSNNSNNNTAAISSTSANSSSSSNRNNVTPIILNREDNIKKETRTVRTTRGPKKALQLTTDEDDSSFIYNISDADDTMLKLVTKDLHSANSIAKTIYDLMDEVVIDMPTWNLHIMPETNSFCIAQVARGRMGIPILKKSIELDQNFTAKVYVHQLHCKRYDGVYSDERSIVNLIKEIDSLSA